MSTENTATTLAASSLPISAKIAIPVLVGTTIAAQVYIARKVGKLVDSQTPETSTPES